MYESSFVKPAIASGVGTRNRLRTVVREYYIRGLQPLVWACIRAPCLHSGFPLIQSISGGEVEGNVNKRADTCWVGEVRRAGILQVFLSGAAFLVILFTCNMRRVILFTCNSNQVILFTCNMHRENRT